MTWIPLHLAQAEVGGFKADGQADRSICITLKQGLVVGSKSSQPKSLVLTSNSEIMTACFEFVCARSGRHTSAKTMLEDILTIRADTWEDSLVVGDRS